jgi:hypothetical protein
LLSTNAGSVGSRSIVIQVGAGANSGVGFYLQALAGSGSVVLHTHAVGFGDATANVRWCRRGSSLARRRHHDYRR